MDDLPARVALTADAQDDQRQERENAPETDEVRQAARQWQG